MCTSSAGASRQCCPRALRLLRRAATLTPRWHGGVHRRLGGVAHAQTPGAVGYGSTRPSPWPCNTRGAATVPTELGRLPFANKTHWYLHSEHLDVAESASALAGGPTHGGYALRGLLPMLYRPNVTAAETAASATAALSVCVAMVAVVVVVCAGCNGGNGGGDADEDGGAGYGDAIGDGGGNTTEYWGSQIQRRPLNTIARTD